MASLALIIPDEAWYEFPASAGSSAAGEARVRALQQRRGGIYAQTLTHDDFSPKENPWEIFENSGEDTIRSQFWRQSFENLKQWPEMKSTE